MQKSDEERPKLYGVIEGFYGKPWTAEQRHELFRRMRRMGLTTYLYAPKDDYKHRLHWRQKYVDAEADDLKQLIQAATAENIVFVYALSPGLDMVASDADEVALLKEKLEQVRGFGCSSFALLFDDIEPELCEQDSAVFSSQAEAQCVVTNVIYKHIGPTEVFMFCPTEYCTSRADPDLAHSQYLRTLGSDLHPNIDILWTGPKVVSRIMTVEAIVEVKEILRRPPLIWDNLHANDYDQTRLYLGPYEGRPQELSNHLRGVLTNPNCEFETNFIAMHTLAQWSEHTVKRYPPVTVSPVSDKANAMDTSPQVDKSGGNTNCDYHARKALICAIEDWLPELYKPKGMHVVKGASVAEDSSRLKVDHKSRLAQSDNDSDMETAPVDNPKQQIKTSHNAKKSQQHKQSESTSKQTNSSATQSSPDLAVPMETIDKDHCDSPMDTKALDQEDMSAAELLNSIKKKKDDSKIEDLPALNCGDMLLLCDLFSVPFKHGPKAVHLLKTSHWLLQNLSLIKDIDCTKTPFSDQPPEVKEWYENAVCFHESYRDVVLMVDKLVAIPNRDLLYDIYAYVNDMRGILSLLNSYIKWNGLGRVDKEPFRGGDQEPWVNRSGIYSEFRRLLPFDGQNDMFKSLEKQPQPSKVFTVRPYFQTDKDDVYNVCLTTCDDGLDGSDLFPNHPALEADQSIGGLLSLHAQYCYVLEDDAVVCGYVLAAPDYKQYADSLVEKWLPQIRKKYPKHSPKHKDSLSVTEEVIRNIHSTPMILPEDIESKYPGYLQMRVKSNIDQVVTASKTLLKCIVKVLKQHGVKGIHAVIPSSHFKLLSFYLRLGFVDVTPDRVLDNDVLILGKLI